MGDTLTLKELISDEGAANRIARLSFEDGLKLLEELVSKVESGSLALDKAILSYEKGVMLIERLRTLLSGAEEKIRVLQKSGNGKLVEKGC